MNSMSHLTPSEYKSILNAAVSKRSPTQPPIIPKHHFISDDESLDLRDDGHVNEIQNLGTCGSSWSFATTAMFESAYRKNLDILYKFSEQFLIDCVQTCDGCNNGDFYEATEYIINNYKGAMIELSEYPYKQSKGTCNTESKHFIGLINNKIFVDEIQDQDIALEYLITIYKIVIACGVDADHASFMLYSSGIYDEPDCVPSNLNYQVNCVGYGSENGNNYFIIRNCWGKSWGENGYIRMLRGTNQCGLSNRFEFLI